MTGYGIGEIARRAGVATSTIRYYERIGLLPPAPRVSGKRRYDPAVLNRLTVIRLAQDAGLSLIEIQTLLNEFPAETPPAQRWRAFAGQKVAEQDAVIRQAQARKAFFELAQDCGCTSLEDCAAGRTPDQTFDVITSLPTTKNR